MTNLDTTKCKRFSEFNENDKEEIGKYRVFPVILDNEEEISEFIKIFIENYISNNKKLVDSKLSSFSSNFLSKLLAVIQDGHIGQYNLKYPNGNVEQLSLNIQINNNDQNLDLINNIGFDSSNIFTRKSIGGTGNATGLFYYKFLATEFVYKGNLNSMYSILSDQTHALYDLVINCIIKLLGLQKRENKNTFKHKEIDPLSKQIFLPLSNNFQNNAEHNFYNYLIVTPVSSYGLADELNLRLDNIINQTRYLSRSSTYKIQIGGSNPRNAGILSEELSGNYTLLKANFPKDKYNNIQKLFYRIKKTGTALPKKGKKSPIFFPEAFNNRIDPSELRNVSEKKLLDGRLADIYHQILSDLILLRDLPLEQVSEIVNYLRNPLEKKFIENENFSDEDKIDFSGILWEIFSNSPFSDGNKIDKTLLVGKFEERFKKVCHKFL